MRNLFCEDDCHSKFCIRRVAGFIGFMAFMGCIIVRIQHPSIDLLGMLSASLIGVTTVDKLIKK
ncbi:hypothetical protein IR083_20975 [Dysgonomonas sp. GY75]|uniref:hypothetical protein n=1 Tax=Dysgonomonas sp. GY75 TaxID=2780419 RepID=UPI00188422DE|nr:hypothetical protein [Dysgonomonas sp. GY75]MBF0651296.1 hypothetical protein [Dysgonomonas sp. GY75]